MRLIEYYQQAITNFYANKLRSLLAILGILVGTTAIVALLYTGKLATNKALEQFKNLGSDLFSISLSNPEQNQQIEQRNQLTLENILKIKQSIPAIKALAPYALAYSEMAYHGHPLIGTLIGTTEELKSVINLNLANGRFISSLDRYQLYCVIGTTLYEKIKSITKSEVLGSQIWLGGHYFTIIGVLKPWEDNAFFNANANETIFIPLLTVTFFGRNNQINNLIMRLAVNSNLNHTQEKLTYFLKAYVPDTKIFFRNAKQIIMGMSKQNEIFTLLIACIGSISLFVGGIGIMNIMLVSVTERRREIGIRKTLGATEENIQFLFLLEAVILSLLGGITGIIFGLIIAFGIAYFADWGFHFFIFPLMIGLILAIVTGIFFGFYPAYRAAKLDPIEGLRYA